MKLTAFFIACLMYCLPSLFAETICTSDTLARGKEQKSLYSTVAYGDISEKTGRAKTEHVNAYTKKDGTHVESYYRSPGK